jgi:hypothetical protein
VHHAALTFKTATDKVVEANRISDFETLAFRSEVNCFDVADAFVANRDGVVRSQLHHEV